MIVRKLEWNHSYLAGRYCAADTAGAIEVTENHEIRCDEVEIFRSLGGRTAHSESRGFDPFLDLKLRSEAELLRRVAWHFSGDGFPRP